MPKTTWSLLVGVACVCLATTAVAATDPGHSPTAAVAAAARPLTLAAALARVLNDKPELAAARAATSAAAAATEQAATFSNPELSFELENFAGSGAWRGLDGAETTLRLAQPFELGGKRTKRRAVAAAEHAVALQRQELTRAELYARTVAAFTTHLAAQQRLHLAAEQEENAARTVASIAAQIEAGKVPTIAAVRSRPLLVEARLEQRRAEAELKTARVALAALLGMEAPQMLVVAGDLAALPPADVAVTERPAPQLALAAAERERAAGEVAVAEAQRLPDLTLGLGVRRFEESGDTALVAGVSLPLPLFDRNRHGIAAARNRLEEARQLERNAGLQFAVTVAQAEEELALARAAAVTLQEELLPAARESFDALDYGYRSGKFGLFELFDAQRQLNATQRELLAAQVACHVAAARRDALLGRYPLAAAAATP